MTSTVQAVISRKVFDKESLRFFKGYIFFKMSSRRLRSKKEAEEVFSDAESTHSPAPKRKKIEPKIVIGGPSSVVEQKVSKDKAKHETVVDRYAAPSKEYLAKLGMTLEDYNHRRILYLLKSKETKWARSAEGRKVQRHDLRREQGLPSDSELSDFEEEDCPNIWDKLSEHESDEEYINKPGPVAFIDDEFREQMGPDELKKWEAEQAAALQRDVRDHRVLSLPVTKEDVSFRVGAPSTFLTLEDTKVPNETPEQAAKRMAQLARFQVLEQQRYRALVISVL